VLQTVIGHVQFQGSPYCNRPKDPPFLGTVLRKPSSESNCTSSALLTLASAPAPHCTTQNNAVISGVFTK